MQWVRSPFRSDHWPVSFSADIACPTTAWTRAPRPTGGTSTRSPAAGAGGDHKTEFVEEVAQVYGDRPAANTAEERWENLRSAARQMAREHFGVAAGRAAAPSAEKLLHK